MSVKNLFASIPLLNIKHDYPLAALTTLGTGGSAEFFAQPESVSQLQELVKSARDISVYVLGGGSNIIIPDGTIHGLVISIRSLKSLTWKNKNTAEVEAGYSLPLLVKTLRDKALGGLEFSAGIPGTLGGAVSGNAGAGGHGVCEFADEVRGIDSSGSVITFRRGEFDYGYRHCSLSGVIITSALMTFRDALPDDGQVLADFTAKRKSQPLEFRSAGCTFKNPEGHSAGRLLDECGCKNLSVGDAVVSEKHANFILNRGHAKSSDIIGLAELCAEKVYKCTGIKLEQEIKTLSPCFYV